ncbi:SLAM family member 9-like [Carettochelys insculpta]|uniref:SLAM family member 9-like n=1 Tax=Carettochelys insculpta TaxID=44489 RepID=UPI003EB8A072
MQGALRSPSFLLLLLLLQPGGYPGAAADEGDLEGVLGGSVTFPLRIPPTHTFKHASWMVNETQSLATVAAGRPPRLQVFNPFYGGRLRLPGQGYSLELSGLRPEDEGRYSVEYNTDQEAFGYQEFKLRLTKGQLPPTITCQAVACGTRECTYTLRCALRDGAEDVTYSWSHAPGSVLARDSVLRIPRRPQEAGENLTCTAQLRNGTSSRTVFPKEFCAEQVPGTTILCESARCGSGACNYTLRCVAEGRGRNVAYSWTREAGGAVLSTSPRLRVSLGSFEVLPAITCTVQHPGGNSSRTVRPQELCPGSPPHPSLASSLSYRLVLLLLALGALSATVLA